MTKEEALAKITKALNNEPWISPDWEPWARCSEEEKQQLVWFLDTMAALYPKSLGAIAVVFENCSPDRQFLMFEPELGHNSGFLSELLGEKS